MIWSQEVTLVRWTQPSGPLCLWQCFFYRASLGGNWGWKLEQASERTRGNDASLPGWTSQHWTSNIPLENKGRTSPHYWALPLCEAPPCATSRSTNTLLSFKVTTVAHHTCQRFSLLVVFYVGAYIGFQGHFHADKCKCLCRSCHEVATVSQGLCLFVVLSCVFHVFHLVTIINYFHPLVTNVRKNLLYLVTARLPALRRSNHISCWIFCLGVVPAICCICVSLVF